MKKYAVIVAGGSGTRMQTEISKQFLIVAKKPILLHTLERFYNYDKAIEIIVVLPKTHFAYWENLVKEYHIKIPHLLAEGGKIRGESVLNGLAKVQQSESLVAIHDGVRPFVSTEIIQESFEVAEKKGNAIASVALKDSIREVEPEQSFARDRSRYRLVQTPQTFKTDLIKSAYSQVDYALLTDDASVAEAYGVGINLIKGDYKNIKITTPEDLAVAEALLDR